MMSKKNIRKIDRRSMLKAISGSTATLPLVGSSVARSQSEKHSDDSSDSGSVELKAENSGSKEEWRKMMKRRGISHPAVNDGITTLASGSELQNLTYVDHWKEMSYTDPDCYPGDDPDFETEHVCTVYKATDDSGGIVRDGDGQYRYIVELWQQSQKRDSATYCSGSIIKELNSRIYDKDGDVTFHDRDPSGTSRVNDERVTVRHYTEASGVAFGGDDVLRFNDGRFGASRWTPGSGGEYKVFWTGEEDFIQDITAFIDIGCDHRVDFDDNSGISWQYYVNTGW